MKIDARGPNGNAFAIMGHVKKLLEFAGRTDEVSSVMKQMQSGDYDHLCDVAEEVTFGTITIINRDG